VIAKPFDGWTNAPTQLLAQWATHAGLVDVLRLLAEREDPPEPLAQFFAEALPAMLASRARELVKTVPANDAFVLALAVGAITSHPSPVDWQQLADHYALLIEQPTADDDFGDLQI